MASGVGTLTLRGDCDKRSCAAEVFRIPDVVGPATGPNLDVFRRRGGAGNVMKRTIRQIIEWRRMCLECDGFIRVRRAQDACSEDDVEWLCSGGERARVMRC